jgi:hypothetical protein
MPIRGIFTINGRTFAVADNSFSEIFSNMTQTFYGNVSNDSRLVSMAASGQQLLLASAGFVYLFDLNTNTLTQVPQANFTGAVAQVGYSDGFFIALVSDSNRFYVSGLLDANDWTTNGASLVSVFPDNLTSMLVDHRELWFWSKTKAVVYYDSGNVFPFDVVPGGYIEQGCVARFSPVKLDNTILWLGSDERGSGIVWRTNGYTPQRISNHAIEFAVQGYDRIDDAIGYSFQMQGHSFYHLYFPSADKSWRYDTATNMWHEVAFWDQTFAVFRAHKSQVHIFNFGKHLVGDWQSNKIYDMEIPKYNAGVWDFATDDGNLIRRVRRAAHISSEQKEFTHHQIQLFLETGLGPIPPLPGFEVPTSYILADNTGALWSMGVSDIGILTTTGGAFGLAKTLFLNDTDEGLTSWQVEVSPIGALTTTQVTFNALYPTFLAMVSASGNNRYTLHLNNIGLLITDPNGGVYRDPQISLSWSDDSAHTWSNEYILDAGQAGEYKARVMRRRLGRARDRVYQISMSDPVPWRIVAGYAEIGNG